MKEKSCEFRYYRYCFYLFLIVCLIILIPVSLILFLVPTESKEESILLFFFLLLFLGPFLLYYGYRMQHFRKLKPKYVQEVKLEKVESSFNRLVRFVIIMEIEGKRKEVLTLAVFNPGIFGPNLIEDYSQKRALVGYDEKYDIAVVLRTIED